MGNLPESLPCCGNDMESWIEDLRKRSKNRTEMWKNNLPSGTWTWYYDDGGKESELEFDEEYPVYFTSWYKNGKKTEEDRYKDFFPRGERWRVYPEDSGMEWNGAEWSRIERRLWNPLIAGYIVFIVGYACTTLVNFVSLNENKQTNKQTKKRPYCTVVFI